MKVREDVEERVDLFILIIVQRAQVIVANAQVNNECVVVKAPRLIFLLPLVHQYFPGAKYVQVIRDGRGIYILILLSFSFFLFFYFVDFSRYGVLRQHRTNDWIWKIYSVEN